jgi:hypothetical protein
MPIRWIIAARGFVTPFAPTTTPSRNLLGCKCEKHCAHHNYAKLAQKK